jgi:hypothetical protein
MALFNKGVTLGQLGRSEQEISVYDHVIVRFGAASELALREQVAEALVNKWIALGRVGRNEEAIAIYDEVLAHFGADKEPAIKSIVAKAKRLRRILQRSHGSRIESQ